VHDISILGGTAYSRDDGIAIDVLYIRDGHGQEVEESRWLMLAEAIPQALLGAFPIDERLAAVAHVPRSTPLHPIATTVHVDNSDSDDYSIIEVTAADRIGLLYAITQALHALRLDIHLAKVDTLGSEVVDAFYVLRETGQRVEAPDEIERVQRRIVEAIAALDA
jgi:[protein-PII] uridylyltransferase